jgi:hypothetical protein
MKIFSKLYSAKYLYKHAPERTMILNSSQTKKKRKIKKKAGKLKNKMENVEKKA